LTNIFSGVIAGLILLVLALNQGLTSWRVPKNAWGMVIAAGALGVAIIMGISFSLSRTGVTAGLASIILGQMFISMIADTTGWGGVEPIPLSLQRIAGLVVMFIAVLLLLPKR
jgi:transporter family-2 protein